MAEWSELPRELLGEILTRLNSPIDASRFGSVCLSWRKSLSSELNDTSPPGNSFPLSFNGISICKRSIFLLSPPQIPVFELPHNPNSWVIKVEERSSRTFRLFFPLSGTHISLPINFPRVLDLSNIRIRDLGSEYFLRHTDLGPFQSCFLNFLMDKVAFLSRSNGVDFFLLTIYVSGKLVLFDSVGIQWHDISGDVGLLYDDVIAFNGEFYAVDNTGRTVLVGIDTLNTVTLVAEPVCWGDKKRLLEIGGELMLVDVYMGLSPSNPLEDHCHDMEVLDDYVASGSIWFKVFRFDKEGKNWVKVKDLGNYDLFLGLYSAFSVPVADLSLHKGNCIYFAFPDNFYPPYLYEHEDVVRFYCGGVFNLEDSSITYSKLFWPPPPWIISSSQEVCGSFHSLNGSYFTHVAWCAL